MSIFATNTSYNDWYQHQSSVILNSLIRTFSPEIQLSSSSRYDILHNLVALLRSREHMPDIPRYILECLLEPLGLVLLGDADSCDILDFTDENEFYPAFVFAVAALGQHIRSKLHYSNNLHLPVRFRISLSGITNADHLLSWQPGIDLLDAGDFVVLRAKSEIGEQAREVHPAGIS